MPDPESSGDYEIIFSHEEATKEENRILYLTVNEKIGRKQRRKTNTLSKEEIKKVEIKPEE